MPTLIAIQPGRKKACGEDEFLNKAKVTIPNSRPTKAEIVFCFNVLSDFTVVDGGVSFAFSFQFCTRLAAVFAEEFGGIGIIFCLI